MDYFDVCVAFISLLLGIAYPILIQITSEDKYSSDAVLDLFEGDTRKRFFYINLIVSLVLILVNLVGFEPFFQFDSEFFNYLLNNSGRFLLLISTVFLIVNFFRLINLIQTFYRTSRLIGFLRAKKNEIINDNNFKSFEAMSSILFWSIQNQNFQVAIQLADYFYELFQDYRANWKKENDKKNEGLVYPELFYRFVYDAIEQCIKQEKNSFSFIEGRTSGLTWLLGEFRCPKISESTYVWMWRNIVLASKNDRYDLVFMHWQSAHQYFQMNLEPIQAEYDYSKEVLIVTNEKEISERTSERERFLEFHYALGGLLLFKGEIKLIKKIFSYTTSQPAQFNLLPMQMTEIFNLYFKFLDPSENYFPWITQRYYFPDLDGMNAQGLIKNWICRYIGVLYLRQFNVHSYYTFHKPTEKPMLPETVDKKRRWLNNIEYFVNIVKDHVSNNELLSELNYEEAKGQYLGLIMEVVEDINADFDHAEKTAVPMEAKVNLFYDTAREKMVNTIKPFKKLGNSDVKMPDENDVFNINGHSNVTEKGSFTENGIDHLNFHSFLPDLASKNYQEAVSSIFHLNARKKYFVNQEDVFKGIDRLGLNPKKHVIVLFGRFDFGYFSNNLKVQNLTQHHYNGIEILHYPVSARHVGNSYFILKKKHLPWIQFNQISEKLIQLYELQLLDENFQIYSSVSDLNTNLELRQAVEKEEVNDEKDLEKFVFQGVVYRTTFHWSKKTKIVQIRVKGYFDNQMETNDLSDIKSF